MTQPKFVPAAPGENVRRGDQNDVPYPVPEGWEALRPAEINGVTQPEGPLLGSAGPDQGYGLKLARRLKDELLLTEHEHAEDAVAGCLGTALKRARLYGRAPVIYDFQLAYTLWGFMGEPPADLVAYRKPLFEAASHHYEVQRAITDAVADSTLRMTPADVATRIGEWRTLITVK